MVKKLNKYYLLEAQANKKLGLTSTSGSGSKFDDADGKASLESTNKLLNECKYRADKFVSIPFKEWEKLQIQANRLQKIPVFTTIRDTPDGVEFYTTLKTDDLANLMNKKPSQVLEELCIEIVNKIQLHFKNNLMVSKGLVIELLKKIFLEKIGK